jgi:Zn-dependent protease
MPDDDLSILRWCLPAGSISGVRLSVHWSFPLLLLLFPAMQGSEHGAWWGFVIAVAVPLLLCLVLFREIGRISAARRAGVPVPGIAVWPLGGLTTIGARETGRRELRLATAGPLVNLLLAAFFLAAFSVTGVVVGADFLSPFHWWPVSTVTGAADFGEHVLYVVHKLNLIVLLFNLIPAWPLDGGRIVRGLLIGPLSADRGMRITAAIALGSTAAMFGYTAYSGHYLVAGIAGGVFLMSLGLRKQALEPAQ